MVHRVSWNSAIQLGCLDIRKLFRDLNSTALEKKINVDYLEKIVGLKNFFPESLLTNNKTKTMRRQIKYYLKEYEGLDENTCLLKYYFILKSVWDFDHEHYECSLGFANNLRIELIIAPALGINYRVKDPNSQLFCIARFNQIKSIKICDDVTNVFRAVMSLSIDDTSEPFELLFTDELVAQSVCQLIDGYCMLQMCTSQSFVISSDQSSKKEIATATDPTASVSRIDSPVQALASSFTPKPQKKSRFSCTSDSPNYRLPPYCYSHFDQSYIIPRSAIELVKIIGQGNFGQVYKARYVLGEVAAKVGQDHDPVTIERFLRESAILYQFNHPHIIKMIGICPVVPFLIVMELAKLGELRRFLHDYQSSLNLRHLILYCCQLSGALDYLEKRKYVHRDIATRNVLVTEFHCVKLADFGLSRELQDNYYKISKGRLPIRWMAPESINFRRFTHSSDVWMFGVCIWEILSKGKKPFSQLSNSSVILKIESGEKLQKPDNCPDKIYQIMKKCWEYEPSARPTFAELRCELRSILLTMKNMDLFTNTASHHDKEIRPNQCPTVGPGVLEGGNNYAITNTDIPLHVYSELQNNETQPSSVQNHKLRVISNLYSRVKQVVGTVVLLNFTMSSQGVNTIGELALHVKSIAIAVKEFLSYVQSILHCVVTNNDNMIKSNIADHQDLIAAELNRMVEDLKNNSVKNVVQSAILVAKSSKNIFCELQTFFSQI
ncbi:hypothetical protein GJ496_006160 [Pomphorhynchus laevis]|nr:hypothetical protein GJ496_006160 [Pomphorhynchus laevis]